MATRLTPLILIWLLAGCQAVREAGRKNSPPIGNVSSLDRGFPTPRPLSRLPTPGVQLAAFIEPVDPLPLVETDALPIPLHEAESEFTLQQLEQLAMASNPSLAEARARVVALRGKWVQVGLLPNTVVGYSGQQLGSGGKAEQQGLLVAQEFVRGGKPHLDRAVVSREIQKAEQWWSVQQHRVLTDVRLAFYEVLVAQRRNETADQVVQIAQQAVDTAESLLQAKEVSQVDVMRARIELQTAQLILKNVRNLHTAVWSRLCAVIGVQDMQPQPLSGDVERAIDEIDPDVVLARLINDSPEMTAALSEVERARWAVRRAYAESVPNIDVEAIVQSDNGTGGSNANLQVSLPIPWRNRNQGGIRQAQAEVVSAERAVDRLKLSFQQRLASVYLRYANARNQVTDYSKEEGILANSKATLELVRKGYQAGESSYLDLITVQRTFSQTNLDYLEALGEFWAAVVEIEGLLLKDSLDSGLSRS